MTRKYKQEFQRLELLGYLDTGNHTHIFCLIQVFLHDISADVNAHYEAMRYRRKPKSTRNPEYIRGTHRRIEIYQEYQSFHRPCTQAELDTIRSTGEDYWRGRSTTPSPWEVDPLDGDINRQASRRRAMCYVRPQLRTLSETYIAYVSTTIFLSDPVNQLAEAGNCAQHNLIAYRNATSTV